MTLTVLLGGTFDPPHIGHLVAAECARAQLGAGQVVFLPAGEPWRKASRAVTPAHHRLEMVQLAVRDHLAFVVDDREVRRPGPTYTVDTLLAYHAEGHTDLALILGADALADMPNWHEYHRIGELATILIALKGADEGHLPGMAAAAGLRNTPAIVDMPRLPLSSTLMRERVAAGKPIRYLVPNAVEHYIRDERLYLPAAAGASTDAEDA